VIEVGQKFSDGDHEWTVAKIRGNESSLGWMVILERDDATLTLYGKGRIETSKQWRDYFGSDRD
jgi:hypothetical protein